MKSQVKSYYKALNNPAGLPSRTFHYGEHDHMNISSEVKTKYRFRLLHKIYEITGGVAERHALDIKQIGDEIGTGPFVALEAFDFLRAEGLTKWVASGYKGTITALGLEEVKDALAGKASIHFPANILAMINTPEAPVETPAEIKLRQQAQQAAMNAAGGEYTAVAPLAPTKAIEINKENYIVGMQKLAEALTALRLAISERVSTVDDYIELGKVAAAEKAAMNRDARSVFEHLSQLAPQDWGITCKVGIEIAIATAVQQFDIDIYGVPDNRASSPEAEKNMRESRPRETHHSISDVMDG